MNSNIPGYYLTWHIMMAGERMVWSHSWSKVILCCCVFAVFVYGKIGKIKYKKNEMSKKNAASKITACCLKWLNRHNVVVDGCTAIWTQLTSPCCLALSNFTTVTPPAGHLHCCNTIAPFTVCSYSGFSIHIFIKISLNTHWHSVLV